MFDVFNYVSEHVRRTIPSQHPIFKANDLEENFPVALECGVTKSLSDNRPTISAPPRTRKPESLGLIGHVTSHGCPKDGPCGCICQTDTTHSFAVLKVQSRSTSCTPKMKQLNDLREHQVFSEPNYVAGVQLGPRTDCYPMTIQKRPSAASVGLATCH